MVYNVQLTLDTNTFTTTFTLSAAIRFLTLHCDLLGYCTVSSGYFLPTFRDTLSVPPSGFKNSWPLNVCNNGEQRSSHDRLHLQHVSHRDSRSITARGFNTAQHFSSKWYPKTVDLEIHSKHFLLYEACSSAFSLRQGTPHCDNHCCLRSSAVTSN